MCPNLYTVVNDLDFYLYINYSLSVFHIDEKLKNDFSTEIKLAKLKAGYNGETLIKNDSIYMFNFANYLEKDLILKKEKKINWNITNEIKLINDLTCIKAETIIEIKNNKGVFKNTIIAWFCPIINFSYGPLGYCGLPGLILELQTQDFVYGAKNIEFNYNSNYNIPKIIADKAIDKLEFENKLNNYREELKKQ